MWVNGLSSVEAWFSIALDIEEVLSGVGGDWLHVMVADVIKSFDTVDRSILDCALGRLGLPDWFRKTHLAWHSQVRLRFKLAAGLGVETVVFFRVVPLSTVFIVALYVPSCRDLEALPDVKPQLYDDNLKCSAERPGALFESARFTARYVRSVGQDVSPGKCVLPSSEGHEALGHFWFSWMFGTLVVILILPGGLVLVLFLKELVRPLWRLLPVGALPLGFHVKLGLVRGKYLPAGLHAAEASSVSSSAISALRAAIVRAVWSSKNASCQRTCYP